MYADFGRRHLAPNRRAAIAGPPERSDKLHSNVVALPLVQFAGRSFGRKEGLVSASRPGLLMLAAAPLVTLLIVCHQRFPVPLSWARRPGVDSHA
jgi:hypothetical protein